MLEDTVAVVDAVDSKAGAVGDLAAPHLDAEASVLVALLGAELAQDDHHAEVAQQVSA